VLKLEETEIEMQREKNVKREGKRKKMIQMLLNNPNQQEKNDKEETLNLSNQLVC